MANEVYQPQYSIAVPISTTSANLCLPKLCIAHSANTPGQPN